MKNKALIVTTTPYMIRQFLMNDIKLLQKIGYDVEIATNFKGFNVIDDEHLMEFRKILIGMNIKINQVSFSRNILDVKSMISSYREMGKLLKENRYVILHTHTPIASVISRICARPFRKSGLIVLYTAHGFHFYKGASIKNWLLFYPIERWLSNYTDVLITINKEDYERAKTQFKSKEIIYLPGIGVNVDKINRANTIRNDLCDELKIETDCILLLSVGELSNRKNHQAVIRSLDKLPENVHYLVVGRGSEKDNLIKLCEEFEVISRVHFLGFRSNVLEIMKSCDIFVFPSLQEGLPVALMEAMAAEIPCIVNDIRGNKDLIVDNINGYIFNISDKDRLITNIYSLMNEKKRNCFTKNSLNIIKNFDQIKVNSIMEHLYTKVFKNNKRFQSKERG